MADHLSEQQLAQLQDGDMSARDKAHLERCSECSDRLRDLQAASAAYVEYRDTLIAAAPPKPWRSLAALHAEAQRPSRWRSWWLVPAMAVVCLMVVSVMIWRRPAAEPATDLLTRSANAETPSDRMISMQVRGRTLLRPAVLPVVGADDRDPDMQHLRMLFAEAQYDWRSPISARTYQSWRMGQRNRTDTVSVIDAGGPEEAYRVRTDTSNGILHSASLILRGKSLHATNGSFQFEGEDGLEIGEVAPAGSKTLIRPVPGRPEPPAETPASAADTLHVLAALNEIGADVGEPIVISEDDQHQVVVRANALNPARRQEVAAALRQLPNVKLELDAPTTSHSPATPAPSAQRFSTGMPEPLRQQLEDRLGGAMALQGVTDSVLEASGLAVSRAHAIETLAAKFPPESELKLSNGDRELLQSLRQRHLVELRHLTARIRSELKPLLPATPSTGEPVSASWQTQVAELVTAAQRVDDSLNRLLAGSYSQSEGEAMLRALNQQLVRLEHSSQ